MEVVPNGGQPRLKNNQRVGYHPDVPILTGGYFNVSRIPHLSKESLWFHTGEIHEWATYGTLDQGSLLSLDTTGGSQHDDYGDPKQRTGLEKDGREERQAAYHPTHVKNPQKQAYRGKNEDNQENAGMVGGSMVLVRGLPDTRNPS